MSQVLPLRHVAEIRVSNIDKKTIEGQRKVRLCNYTDVYYKNRITSDLDLMPSTATPQQIAAFTLAAGDTLITKDSETAGDIAVAAYVPESLPGVASGYHLAIVRPSASAIHPLYLHYAIQSDFMREQFSVRASGVTRFGLTYTAIRSVEVPIASERIDEQRRISDFLDDQVTRIDQATASREHQMRLIDERLAHVIVSTVRGTGPGRRFDSHISWLGSVHHEHPLKPIGSQFEVLLGKMLNEERSSADDQRPYLRNTNVQWRKITTADLKTMSFPLCDRARFSVRRGDLLICEGGQPGRAAIWDGRIAEMYYQKALHRARPRGHADPRWLYYLLRAAVSQDAFTAGVEQTTIVHLTGEQLNALRLPFPDSDKHRHLARQLAQAEGDAETTTHELAKSIRLLQERKRALITACVTGEFDVTTASDRASEAVIR